MDIVKFCKVHGMIEGADIKSGIYKGKRYRKCRKCEQDRGIAYHKRLYANEDKVKLKREKDKAYWRDNKPKIMERRQKPEAKAKRKASNPAYYAAHKDYYAHKQQHYKEELADCYVKKVIQGGDKSLKFEDIPESLVELKRAVIRLKRGMKCNRIETIKERLANED